MSVKVEQKNKGWLSQLMQKVRATEEKVVAVGFPAGKQQAYPTGELPASVAASHVYGVGVPQRDFMAYAQRGIEEATSPIMQAIAKASSEDKIDTVAKLQEAAGLAAAQEIKNAILEGDWQPNSPATIAAKKSSKPLIDTSHMINSVTYVVRPK